MRERKRKSGSKRRWFNFRVFPPRGNERRDLVHAILICARFASENHPRRDSRAAKTFPPRCASTEINDRIHHGLADATR